MGMMVQKFCSLKWLYTAGILILFIVTVFLIAKPEFSQTHQEDTYIAIVDGEEIHVSEFQRAIRANRAEIIKYFHEKYDVCAVCRFWSTPYGDETPLELIKRRHSKTASILKFDRSLLKSRACSPISVTTVLYKISCLKTREGDKQSRKIRLFSDPPNIPRKPILNM